MISQLSTSNIGVRIKGTSAWKFLRQRWHYPRAESLPTFLIGCGRSGTSMIVNQLGKSWQVDVYNENHPEAFHEWRLRELAHISGLVRRSHAPVILFKPILDTFRARQFLDHFPGSRILFTFRHYDDVINSSIKKFGEHDRIDHVNSWVSDGFSEFERALPPQETQDAVRSLWAPGLSPQSGAALYWLLQNRLYFDLGLIDDGRVSLVCYESLVSDPWAEFNRICDFLEIDFEQQMAGGVFNSSIGGGSKPALPANIRNACQDLWEKLCDQISASNSS